MKYRLPIYALFILGVAEMFYGAFWGPLIIYANEGRLGGALQREHRTEQQYQAFVDFVVVMKSLWPLVFAFGVITIVLAITMLIQARNIQKAWQGVEGGPK